MTGRSTSLRNGGPAFPSVNPFNADLNGMSLRDWFAGQALAGLLILCVNDSHKGRTYPEHVSKNAYEVADAMLAERTKEAS